MIRDIFRDSLEKTLVESSPTASEIPQTSSGVIWLFRTVHSIFTVDQILLLGYYLLIMTKR